VRRPGPRGRWQRVSADAWPQLDALYAQHHLPRTGALSRSEERWRYNIFQDYGEGVPDAAIWSNAAGEPRAYVVYRMRHRPTGSSPFGETVLRVLDWIALDTDAYAAVLGYLLSHDLATRIVLMASQDDPVPDAFEEPVHIAEPPGAWFGTMLRLIDVQRAVEARPALPQASGKSVTIALIDETAPWNAGTWRIESHEGRMSAERTDRAPELEMDVRALAPIYNGFTRPAEAVRVGAVRATSDRAVAAATDLFGTSFAPYCPDDF
jgi:predicted acetyltransferase